MVFITGLSASLSELILFSPSEHFLKLIFGLQLFYLREILRVSNMISINIVYVTFLIQSTVQLFTIIIDKVIST